MITDDGAIRVLELADPARADDHAPMLEPAEYREALHAGRIAVTLIDSEPKRTRPTGGRRSPMIIVAAAAVLIVVSGLVLVARDDAREPQAPAGPPPATGDLIVALWSHAGGGSHPNDHVRVYADGRFLRNRDATGWQERRLTAEGVELLRSEISSSGLFDPDQPVPYGGGHGIIEVLNGDTAVQLHCCWGPSLEWLTENFDRLLNRLRVPESWLPPSAWEDLESTPYVPSWYAVCLSSVDMAPQPLEPSPLVSVLPAPAQDALDGARHWSEPQDHGGPPWRATPPPCYDLDADNARRFTAALDDAGIEPIEGDDTYFFQTDSVVGTVTIFVSPYLPHGAADCGCSG